MKNNKGFSLIEIMIAIGLLCGLSVWMMHLFKQQTRNEKTTAANMDIDSIGNEIRNILTDGLSCEKTFKGQKPNQAAAASAVYKLLADGNYQKRHEVGERKNNNTGVMVKSYDLKTDETYFVPQGQKEGETVLIVTWDRGSVAIGGQNKDFKIPLSVTLDNDGNIQNCHSMASQTNLASLCAALGRGVDLVKKRCSPPSYFYPGDLQIFTKRYVRCQGGTGAGEHVLAEWTATSSGGVRVSWAGYANDTSVLWKVYKNTDVLYTQSGSGNSSDSNTLDVPIAKGDKIKHTVTLSGGVDNDCVGDGLLTIGADLLNIL